jgi:hypothetical protein
MSADWFVGSVAFALAGLSLVAALGDWAAPRQFWLARYLEGRCGRTGSRGLFVAGAFVLAGIGAFIISGARPPATQTPDGPAGRLRGASQP